VWRKSGHSFLERLRKSPPDLARGRTDFRQDSRVPAPIDVVAMRDRQVVCL
jgi:hypothetical protein